MVIPEAIYYVPHDDGVQEHYALMVTGGPKTFMNVWLEGNGATLERPNITWNWHLHPDAITLWTDGVNR